LFGLCGADVAHSNQETTMTRLDPHALPDRFALDRYARQMRADEMARIARAAVGGFRAIAHALADRVRRTVAAGTVQRHPHASA
jgi:hypothetical protein